MSAKTSEEFVQQFGASLWSSSKQEHADPSSVLSNKVVLLYFSAHWCGPCRKFTPALKEFYTHLKEHSLVDFEVLFLSMDRTEAEYQAYTDEMPWWSLPYGSKAVPRLANQYGAMGIPHLVVVDVDGRIISRDGVGDVSIDPLGKEFPWRPKPIVELMPKQCLTKDGLQPMKNLDDKYLMVYFSASWCPPCQLFTPLLIKAYRNLKNHRSDFELLFASSDQSQEEFDAYYEEMPWCAVEWEDRLTRDSLSKRLEVLGLPTLIMLGPCPAEGQDRPIINTNIRNIIENGDYISDFPYHPKPYGDLNDTSDDINLFKCLIVFVEGCDDEEQENAQAAVQAAAENYKGNENVKFYWALLDMGLSSNVRKALKLDAITEDPVMVLLDISDDGAFYKSEETDIAMETILKFVESPGERQQIE